MEPASEQAGRRPVDERDEYKHHKIDRMCVYKGEQASSNKREKRAKCVRAMEIESKRAVEHVTQ